MLRKNYSVTPIISAAGHVISVGVDNYLLSLLNPYSLALSGYLSFCPGSLPGSLPKLSFLKGLRYSQPCSGLSNCSFVLTLVIGH